MFLNFQDPPSTYEELYFLETESFPVTIFAKNDHQKNVIRAYMEDMRSQDPYEICVFCSKNNLMFQVPFGLFNEKCTPESYKELKRNVFGY